MEFSHGQDCQPPTMLLLKTLAQMLPKALELEVLKLQLDESLNKKHTIMLIPF